LIAVNADGSLNLVTISEILADILGTELAPGQSIWIDNTNAGLAIDAQAAAAGAEAAGAGGSAVGDGTASQAATGTEAAGSGGSAIASNVDEGQAIATGMSISEGKGDAQAAGGADRAATGTEAAGAGGDAVPSVAGDGAGVASGTGVTGGAGDAAGAGAANPAATGTQAAGGAGSATPSGQPTQPVISATPGNGQIVIAPVSGGAGAISYDIYWDTISHASQMATNANHIVGVSIPYTHTGRTNGTTYYYSLVAINAGGPSESAEASGTPVAPIVWPDHFTAANGSAPSSDYWTVTNPGGGLKTGSTVDIQSNRLRVHFGSADGTTLVEYLMTGKVFVTDGVGVKAQMPTNGVPIPTSGKILYQILFLWDSATGGPQRNCAEIQLFYDAGGVKTVVAGSYNNAGAWTMALARTSQDAIDAAYTWEIRRGTGNQVSIYKGATLLQTFTATWTLGSSLGIGMLFLSSDDTIRDLDADDVYLGV
jgi:hypothetical protein